jgi:RNA polymerase sigma factor (sigma-70 family)
MTRNRATFPDFCVIFRRLVRWSHVSVTLPLVDSPGDAELISAVRGGDADAYGELFSRHVEAARRLGRQLVSGPDVDDLVADAFAKVFVVLRRGGGPDLAFRAYLLTAVRRLHVDRLRVAARLRTTDDLSPFDAGIPFRDTAVEGFENATVARAFGSLPERWQLVLWHTEVEGQKPAEVGLLLGMSANSVSALAYRAREGLRQAFLSLHAQDTMDDACAETRGRLGSYLRDGVSRRDRRRIEKHLGECRRCAAIYLELGEVNSNLSGLLAPVLLGGAAGAYVASCGAAASSAGLLVLLGRVRDLVLAHAPATAAGVGAGALVVGGLFLGLRAPGPEPRPVAPDPSGPSDVRIAPHGQPAPPAKPVEAAARPVEPAAHPRPVGRPPRDPQRTREPRVVPPPASAQRPTSLPRPAPRVPRPARPALARPAVAAAPATVSAASGPDLPNESSGPSGPALTVTVTARPTAETEVAVRARVAVPAAPVRPVRPVRPVHPVRSEVEVEAGAADTFVRSRRLAEQPPESSTSGEGTSPAHRVGMGP